VPLDIRWRSVLLQRGRARAGAEFARPVKSYCPGCRLQRGRARAGAEFNLPWDAPAARALRFNGAAPARARNSKQSGAGNLLSWLQRGRARAGAELALLLLLLAQARNTSIAIACAVCIAFVLTLSRRLVILVYCKVVTSCERKRGFPRHLAARGLICQRSPTSQTT